MQRKIKVEQVTILSPSETARLDHDQLQTLYCQLGPSGAEDVVCRAMEELAHRLGQVDALYCAGNLSEMRKTTRALIAIAEQVGMRGLARVAGDVVSCIDDGDAVALAATLARLARMGERSLTAVWDLQDLSV